MNKNILLRDGELSRPKAVAAAIFPQGGEQACETSLTELERLLDTAGAHGVEVEYIPEGMLVTATVDAKLRGRFAAYLLDPPAYTDDEEDDEE